VSAYGDNNNSGSSYNLEEVQDKLRSLGQDCPDAEVKKAMDGMNETARLVFCRLVLEAEYRWQALEKMGDAVPRELRKKADGPFERSDIMEFLGLCCAMVKLSSVQDHLCDGTNLLDLGGTIKIEKDEKEEEDSSSIEKRFIQVQGRLDKMQHLLLRAVGYDPDYATEEVKRIFLTPHQSGSGTSEYSQDTELHTTFEKTVAALSECATNAALHRKGGVEKLSDHEEGGVTRVISVSHSEKIVEAGAWKEQIKHNAVGEAPKNESMEQQTEEEQMEQLRLAREAAALQQSILHELLTMSEKDRNANLQVAKEAHDEFLSSALKIPAGPERIQYLRNVDPNTQRLLVMHKLWSSMLEKNGGVPPTMHHQHQS